jgi:hypothetical protein
MVEKVQVPESRVFPTHKEWDKAFGPDVKGFGSRVQEVSGRGI